MKLAKFLGAALTGVILLAACGEAGGSKIIAAAGKVAPLARGIGSSEESAASASRAAYFAPESIAAAPDRYLLLTVNALGLNEMAYRVSGDERLATYQAQSGAQFTLLNGVLVSTRGFGDDLLTSGGNDLLASIRSGQGEASRIVEVLGVQNDIEQRNHRCSFTDAGSETVKLGLSEVAARRVNESCVSQKSIFENIYWLDNKGNIIASRQYVSPSVAYLRVNRL